MSFQNISESAKKLDEQDPLKEFRGKFFIPQHQGKDCIYFTGNSLGLQPRSTSQYVQQELDDWAQMGVEGHFHAKNPWMPYHEIFPKQLSKIVGCKENEVVVMNSLTVNLHLLMVSFYRPTKNKYKIICEAKAFPSDQYALETQVRHHGFDPAAAVIEVSPREGEYVLRIEDIVATIKEHGDSVAVVLFGGVNYYTGQLFDMKSITKAAHAVGAFAGFDLAHAAGNVDLHLHDWDVDFACWCSYKYMNSGPGGVSGIYIHEKHASDTSVPRFAGWWGYTKETRFKMEKGFHAIPTAEGWQLSNAPVLSMAAHKASLDIFDEAGIGRLHEKRKLLSGYLHYILREINSEFGNVIHVITPADENERGCQVSMLVENKGKEMFEELTKQGVVADWREPNVIRIAPVPLYNTFEDIWRFGNIIESILKK
ncbi:MAG TPA: kynureninase [Chitinophagaceae bacterium]|nr:kynureninase [Chitinophagaceae bacterium]HPG12737.1 kynureninase [Chitinophagaceae bacterium]